MPLKVEPTKRFSPETRNLPAALVVLLRLLVRVLLLSTSFFFAAAPATAALSRINRFLEVFTVDRRVPVRLAVFGFNSVVVVNFTALFNVDEADDSDSFQEEAR